MNQLGVDKILDNHLPKLPAQSTYNWKDIFYTFNSIFLCGGSCMEDAGDNFRRYFKQVPFAKVPSPDTLLKRIGELATPLETFQSKRAKREGTKHYFNHNSKLNELLMDMYKLSRPNKEHTGVLDYNNTPIFTSKKDATYTYLGKAKYRLT